MIMISWLSLLPLLGLIDASLSSLLEDANLPLCARCACDRSMIPLLIDCSGKQLQRIIEPKDPPNLLSGAFMLDLDFSHNELTKIDPLPPSQVLSLSLKANLITQISDRAFKNLTFLTYLDLSHNDLNQDSLNIHTFEGKYNESQYEPLSLTELDLGYNEISSIDRTSFVHLTNLEVLILDGNPIKALDDQTSTALSSLNSLKVLSFAFTSLKILPENLLLAFPYLKRLDLSGNFFTDIPGDLQHANNLEDLDLDRNAFRVIEENTFEGLESLRTLRLSECPRLRKIDKGAFSHLSNLETLYLNDNGGLSFIHPAAFSGLKAEDFPLRRLYLNGNHLAYLPKSLLPDLANWDQLEQLDLQHNPWACDCHNEWLTSILAKQIETKTVELTYQLECHGPGDLRGVPILQLDLKPKEIPCPKSDNFNPNRENYGVSPHARYKLARYDKDREERTRSGTSGSSNHLAIGVAVVCLLIIVCSACFVGGLWMRKERQQRYRTFHNARFNSSVDAVTPANGGTSNSNHEDIVRRLGGL